MSPVPQLRYLVTIDVDPRYPYRSSHRPIEAVASEAICDGLAWKDGIQGAEVQLYPEPVPPPPAWVVRWLKRFGVM